MWDPAGLSFVSQPLGGNAKLVSHRTKRQQFGLRIHDAGMIPAVERLDYSAYAALVLHLLRTFAQRNAVTLARSILDAVRLQFGDDPTRQRTLFDTDMTPAQSID